MNSGWVILDKDSGLFSRTAGGRIARLFGTRKFGHIGTLDPMASGVLPIAIGGATKIIPFIEETAANIKEYLFDIEFGYETDTLDICGKTLRCDNVVPARETVLAALPSFIGEISQIPPRFSAVHVNGQRAYDLARAGRDIEIPSRRVSVFSLDLIGVDEKTWHFRMRCSRGTYVRSIARDIAAHCGAMATVTMIRRTLSSGFEIKNTLKLDFLENLVNNGADISKYLMPSDFGLGDIPVLGLDNKSAGFYKNGGFITTDVADGQYRVYSGNVFIGIGRVFDNKLHPVRTI